MVHQPDSPQKRNTNCEMEQHGAPHGIMDLRMVLGSINNPHCAMMTGEK